MAVPMIRVEHLAKRYMIAPNRNEMVTLRDRVAGMARNLFKPVPAENKPQPFWALEDVSFEVQQGDVLGVIGRNGAGKSTLLKILSRITEPTQGRVRLRGRVGALLEVGTGFHPELSGRENIYMNGSLLGMRRVEIGRKFDEIVQFAEIGPFLDTPVKHYSSGMYVRLAFAVAAHLEPDILLVDEVLAVGDYAFQQKCLGKMGQVASQGRTVVFVSHNMNTIRSLCRSGVCLNRGRVSAYGEITPVIDAYLSQGVERTIAEYQAEVDMAKPVQILSARVVNSHGESLEQHPFDEPYQIILRVHIRQPQTRIYLNMEIQDAAFETALFSREFEQDESVFERREPGMYTFRTQIPAPLLAPGAYRICARVIQVAPVRQLEQVEQVCPFELVDDHSLSTRLGYPWRGRVAAPVNWSAEKDD